MSTEIIKADLRTEFGKGAARRTRREGKIPAVLYGHGNDPVHLAMPGHDTMMALRHGGANAVIEIEVDGSTQLALTKAIQVDPVRRILEHVDFIAVKRGEKVTVDVQVLTVGDAERGTMVQIENNTVQLEAEATHIPESVEVDIEGLPAGTQILAGALTLPKGSTLLTDAEVLMVNITEAQEADTGEEAAEAEGDAEGEAASAEGGDSE
ncbi:50S ribosomal protein L25/general stress protein Ctc [Nocardioides montaniterrae]